MNTDMTTKFSDNCSWQFRQTSVHSLVNIEGQYTCVHFKRVRDMFFFDEIYQHISDCSDCVEIKNSQLQIPYNLTR